MTPFFRIQTPVFKMSKVCFRYKLMLQCIFYQRIIIRETDQATFSLFKILFSYRKLVGEYGNQTYNITTRLTKCLYRCQTAFSCGDQVFNHYNSLTVYYFAFDEVLPSMTFGTRSNIGERYSKILSHQHTLRYSCSSNS